MLHSVRAQLLQRLECCVLLQLSSHPDDIFAVRGSLSAFAGGCK